ncbi:Fe-Mn family superoxide dismutase [Nonomuraea dietziae]|uniref:Fe-Mn family superoxide dismutase n=1 Tax=Nonomuraea dietziae TaxID=65515 RepID=UPI0033F4352B
MPRQGRAGPRGAGRARWWSGSTTTTPLLVFDAREHTYHLRYRDVRPDAVEKALDTCELGRCRQAMC